MNAGSLRGKKLDHTLLPVMGCSKGLLIIKNTKPKNKKNKKHKMALEF